MTNKAQHTEIPYRLTETREKQTSDKKIVSIIKQYENGGVKRIATMSDLFLPDETEANARFIVQCANSHQALLGALKMCVIELDKMRLSKEAQRAYLNGREAIAQAEEYSEDGE